MDRKRKKNIRNICGVKNINDWVLNRKRQLNDHISRMDAKREVKVAGNEALTSR